MTREQLTNRLSKLEEQLWKLRESFSAWHAFDHHLIESDIDRVKDDITATRTQLRNLKVGAN